MAKLEDNSIMPFGMYKGVTMANVPATYLLWLYTQPTLLMPVKDYITDNLDVLRKTILENY